MRIEEFTISGTVVASEAIKVSALVSLVIAIKSPHHAWPGLLEHEVALTLAFDFMTVLVQQFRNNAKEWERLWDIESYGRYNYDALRVCSPSSKTKDESAGVVHLRYTLRIPLRAELFWIGVYLLIPTHPPGIRLTQDQKNKNDRGNGTYHILGMTMEPPGIW